MTKKGSLDFLFLIYYIESRRRLHKFYEKQGFTLNEIKRNYWADGFDMYSMQYNEL